MNKVIIAAAGSGKTQAVVEMASQEQRPVLITTYTDSNTEEVRNRFYALHGAIPGHVVILPWYTFLLNYGVRPYQDIFISDDIKGVNLVNGQSAMYVSKGSRSFYLDRENRVYSDKIAALMLLINERCEGHVLKNIADIFPVIMIDEVQDMAGYDLDVLETLIQHPSVEITCVGDPRQGIILTSKNSKNKKFRQSGMLEFFQNRVAKYVSLDTSSLQTNYRCTGDICALSDRLYPEFPSVMSGQTNACDHMGCYLVRPADIEEYVSTFRPVQLRSRINVQVCSLAPAQNFGVVKGLSMDHVLVYPTKDMQNWLLNGVNTMKETTCSQLYVAMTRARYSVAFVVDYPDGFQHDILHPYK